MFHVGQLVVCAPDYEYQKIKPRYRTVKRPPASRQMPTPGHTYTIRSVNDWGDQQIVLLFEVDNSHLLGIEGSSIEPGFDARHFRPIDDNRIAIFRQLLVNPPKEVVEA